MDPLTFLVVLAFSYIRFSSKKQREGDSLRRQTEAATDFCNRHNLDLDKKLTLHDLGASAYTGEHRSNPDRYALARFLQAVEEGHIPKGSFLIVENLDRLTREHVRAAVTLFLRILEAGINIATTSPERIFRHDSQDVTDIIIAVVELSRGHGESARKSEMLGKVWAEKKACAQAAKVQPGRKDSKVAGTRILTHRLPGWVQEVGGELVLIPERADVVRRIFAMSREGIGYSRIVAKLTAEKVPTFGKAQHWSRSFVVRILSGREALGEYQPRKREGKDRKVKDGKAIPGYYPAVVDEDTWLAAQATPPALKGKPTKGTRHGQGKPRIGKHADIFPRGILRDARAGGFYMTTTRVDKGRLSGPYRYRVLIPTDGHEGRAPVVSFPLAPFEQALLTFMREIDPTSVLGTGSEPDEVKVLSGEVGLLEAKLAVLNTELQVDPSPTLISAARALDRQMKDKSEALEAAKKRQVRPLSDSWGACKSLVSVLSTDPANIDARLRLRSELARIVEAIWLLPVARGRDRLCYALISFTDGTQFRTLSILYRSPRVTPTSSKPGGVWAFTTGKENTGSLPVNLDIRPGGESDEREQRGPDAVAAALDCLETIDIDLLTRLWTKLPD